MLVQAKGNIRKDYSTHENLGAVWTHIKGLGHVSQGKKSGNYSYIIFNSVFSESMVGVRSHSSTRRYKAKLQISAHSIDRIL